MVSHQNNTPEDAKKLPLSLTFAVSITCIVVLGTAIENIYLARIGLTEFSTPKAKSMFTGLGFAAYIFAPVAPTLFLYSRIYNALKPNLLICAALFCGTTLFTWIVYFYSIQYFVSFSFTSDYHWYSVIPKSIQNLYLTNPDFYANLLLFFAPAYAIGILAAHKNISYSDLRPEYKTYLWAWLTTGILTFPVGYSIHCYPNVNRSVGGGNPTVIYIDCSSAYQPLIRDLLELNYFYVWDPEVPGIIQHIDGGGTKTSAIYQDTDPAGPLILHRDSDDYLYISEIRTSPPINVIAIPKSSILWYRTMSAQVTFTWNGILVNPDWYDIELGIHRSTKNNNGIPKNSD